MRSRIAALCEIAGVFIVGTLLARYVGSAIPSESLRTLPADKPIDFLRLAWTTAAHLLLRYGFILGLAFAWGWWSRRRRVTEYGVTTPRALHMATAIVLFAVGGFVPKLLQLLKDYVPLGAEPPHWAILERTPNSIAFWVYMAAGSYLLVPIVEELFFRGYVQTRLTDDFGAAAAIVMTALFFTLSHRQYFLASVIGVGMIVSLFVSAVFGSYVRHVTGSLVPTILAHAIGNLPVRGAALAALLGMMLVVVVVARRAIVEHARALGHLLRSRDVLIGAAYALALIVIVLAELAFVRVLLLPTALLAIAAALALTRRASPVLR